MSRPSLSAVSVVALFLAASCGSRSSEPAVARTEGGERAEVEASSSSGAEPGDAWASALLDAHARRRAAHCAAPLAWSDTLAAQARDWAAHLAASGCQLEHSQSPYGENLAAGTSGTLSPEDVVDMWYGEGAQYDFARGGFSMETGHFTQVVWTSSTSLGCAMVSCEGLDVWVCNYDPPGNYDGEFQQHVLPTSCR